MQLRFLLVISPFYRIGQKFVSCVFNGSMCFVTKLCRQNRPFCSFLNVSLSISGNIGWLGIIRSLCLTDAVAVLERRLLDTKASTVSPLFVQNLSQFPFESLPLFMDIPSAMSNVRVDRLGCFPTEPSLHLWQGCCWIFKESRRSV